MDAALKQQLVNGVNPMYIRTLENRHTGFANVTTRQLIDHLLNTYGNLTPTNLATNDSLFRQAYDPSQPIKSLYAQIEDAMDLAAAGRTPYTAQQVVSNAYSLVFNTGMFPEACRDWRRRPFADQTWEHFKAAFAEAHADLRLSQQTTQGAGFHRANNAMDSFVTDTADAFANLATATASNRQLMADLAAINKALTKQLADKDVIIARLRGTNNTERPNNTHDRIRNRAREPQTQRRYHNDNYCWSHGYDVHSSHTGLTCRWPKDGHKTEATRTNPMGGSDLNKSLIT
jgi:hypothetical protein